MCGSGAVMIEAAYSHGCISLGGDCDVNLSSVLRETLFNANSMSSGLAKAEVFYSVTFDRPIAYFFPIDRHYFGVRIAFHFVMDWRTS